MLAGSVAGGYIAQLSNLGVPYLARTGLLALTFLAALVYMRDLGFRPDRSQTVPRRMRTILTASIQNGFRRPAVRWIMLGAPFAGAAGIYAFYAMQPYLLELYGDERAYGVAGLAAAIVAGAQIAGGLLVPHIGRVFRRRTTVLLAGLTTSTAVLLAIGLLPYFWVAVTLLVFWGLMFAALVPVRQAYLNAMIPSTARATVLSFDSLLGSTGAVVAQPVLGKAADVWSYPASYALSAAVQALGIPFMWLARRENAPEDAIRDVTGEPSSVPSLT
jgi:MFS family permease